MRLSRILLACTTFLTAAIQIEKRITNLDSFRGSSLASGDLDDREAALDIALHAVSPEREAALHDREAALDVALDRDSALDDRDVALRAEPDLDDDLDDRAADLDDRAADLELVFDGSGDSAAISSAPIQNEIRLPLRTRTSASTLLSVADDLPGQEAEAAKPLSREQFASTFVHPDTPDCCGGTPGAQPFAPNGGGVPAGAPGNTGMDWGNPASWVEGAGVGTPPGTQEVINAAQAAAPITIPFAGSAVPANTPPAEAPAAPEAAAPPPPAAAALPDLSAAPTDWATRDWSQDVPEAYRSFAR